MKSLPKFFVCLLIVLVAAPLDAAAASWMAMGMEAQTSADMTAEASSLQDKGAIGHQSHQHAMPGNDAASHHDADNCDEHCMNCSSHCFSSVAVASSALELDGEDQRLGNLISRALHRAYLLYRPPIAG